MRIKLLSILFLFFVLIQSIQAKDVSVNQAQQIALRFMGVYSPSLTSISVQNTIPIEYHSKVQLYAVNLNPTGFLLVSADDRAKAVVAFVPHGVYSDVNQPAAVAYQIEEYAKEVNYIRTNNIGATESIKQQWKGKFTTDQNKHISSLGPLLTTIWSQGCYYNDSTPVDQGGPCQHVVTGCVATAMSQVINYYNFPVVGNGSHSYSSNYGVLSANFGQTHYHWNLMADTLSANSTAAQIAAVAQLISQAGISVDMMYSSGSSGAYSQDAARAFISYFNFDNSLNLYHKSDYADTTWERMIRTELNLSHPIYYDGSGTGGHAFVCDGYQSGGYFHFNWGWSGAYNGYFTLSNLNPAGQNFSNYCSAVLGMKPGVPTNYSGIADTLTDDFGNLSDGSYSNYYYNNLNCSWLISPPNASSIKLDFYTFNLQAGDSVYIYDGNTVQSGLLGAYSGNTIPPRLWSSGGQIFIKFITNSNDTAAGWSASYQSEYCHGLTYFTNPSDSFSDGSGASSYNNNTSCSWLISDSLSRIIALNFTHFRVEDGYDYVNVYDGTNANGVLLGSFTGYNIPPTVQASSGAMYVEFTSDGGMVDNGWDAYYNFCTQAQLPYTSDSAIICQGDSIALATSSPLGTFAWLRNSSVLASANDTVLYVNQGGEYNYVSYLSGCSPSYSPMVTVVVNPLPLVNLGADTILCRENTILLDAGNFNTYQWNTGDTTAHIMVDSNLVDQYGSKFYVSVSDSNSCVNSDTITITFRNCLSISQVSNALNNINIFPNPVSDRVWIMNPGGKTLDYSVVDAAGKEVVSKQVGEGFNIEIKLGNLSRGTYYLIVQQCTNYRAIKFVKQ